MHISLVPRLLRLERGNEFGDKAISTFSAGICYRKRWFTGVQHMACINWLKSCQWLSWWCFPLHSFWKTAGTSVMALLVSHFFVYTVYNTCVLCSGAGWKAVNTKYSCTCVQGCRAIGQVGFWPNHFFTDQTCTCMYILVIHMELQYKL